MVDDEERDYELDALLSLNGYTYHIGRGDYWVKFEAHTVTPTKHIPHGVSYSLTLHDRNNVRVVGYDNAHKCRPKRQKYRANIVTWDHVHKRSRVTPYEFNSASQLLEDFWKTIDDFI